MNWAFRTGTVLGAIGLLSGTDVFASGGFGPCGGSFWGAMFLVSFLACLPVATLFLVIGIFMELRPKQVSPPEIT